MRDALKAAVELLRETRRFVACNNNFAESVRREHLTKIDQLLAELAPQ